MCSPKLVKEVATLYNWVEKRLADFKLYASALIT